MGAAEPKEKIKKNNICHKKHTCTRSLRRETNITQRVSVEGLLMTFTGITSKCSQNNQGSADHASDHP